MGFDVEDEHAVGPYSIDCYVPELDLGFEADGYVWHKGLKMQKDERRDQWIYEASGIKILRVTEAELRGSGLDLGLKLSAWMDEHGAS